jgi:hypothetical protein
MLTDTILEVDTPIFLQSKYGKPDGWTTSLHRWIELHLMHIFYNIISMFLLVEYIKVLYYNKIIFILFILVKVAAYPCR